MSETTVEALARKMYAAYLGDCGGDPFEIESEDWMNAARAALRHLNCVSPAGEVYVPDVTAAVDAVTFILEHNQGMEEDGTLVRTESGRMAAVALRALTGGTDEG